jgi:hypothetical protein
LFARRLRPAAPAPARRSKSTDLAKALVGGSSVCLLFMPGAWSHVRSEGPEPYTVLLVESEAGKQLALLGQDLHKKLQELEKPRSAPSGAVLIGARYQGKKTGPLAEFTAQFDVYSFVDRAELNVPLAGVELREGCLLDGAPALPVASAGPKSGYVMAVRGQGRHRLEIPFTVRPAPIGAYQELRFSIPRQFSTLLQWTMAGPVQELHLVKCLGEQKTRPSAGGYELTANLGGENAVELRWRSSTPPAASAAVDVREAYFWDLRPGAVALSAALQFTPIKGTVAALALDLPEEIDVRTVQVTSENPFVAGIPVSLLKKWRLTGSGNRRQLRVELTVPTANPVLLSLELVPRPPTVDGQALLKLPAPSGAKQTESFLAYHLEGMDATDKKLNVGATSIGADVFSKVWAGLGQKDVGAVTRAYSFQRTSADAGLALTLTAPGNKAQAAVVWNLGRDYADFVSTLRLAGGGDDISLVEVRLPAGVELATVRGPALHHWSRRGDAVQIWLEQPRKQATLELTGWTPLAQKATANQPGRFILPRIEVAKAQTEAFQLKVRAVSGVAVDAAQLRHLIKDKEPDTFIVKDPSYEGSFQIRLLPLAPDIHILTTAEASGDACLLVSHFHCQVPAEYAGPLRVVLRNCPDKNVRLESLGAAPDVRLRHLGSDHEFEIAMPAGAPQPFTFQIRARLPLKGTAKLALPELGVPGVPKARQCLAVLGPQLRPVNLVGLSTVRDVVKELRYWPGQAERVLGSGSAWHVDDSRRLPNLEVHAPEPAAQVLLAEEKAYLANGRHWVHCTDLLVAARADAEVQVVLPAAARCLAVIADGQALAPRRTGPGTYQLSLAGPSGQRLVRVEWQLPPEAEPLTRPRLDGAHLAGSVGAVVQGEVLIPSGYEMSSPAAGVISSRADQLLARARAQLAMGRFLSTPSGSDTTQALVLSQKSFWRSLRQAERQLSNMASSDDKTRTAAAVRELRQEYQRLVTEKGLEAVRAQLEAVRAQAEKNIVELTDADTSLFALPEQGRPFLWQATPAGRPATLNLVESPPDRTLRRWSEVLVLAAVLLLMLSFVPRGLKLLALFWPETVFLLALAGMAAWGVSLLGLVGASLAILGRAFWLARGLVRFTGSLLRPGAPAQ